MNALLPATWYESTTDRGAPRAPLRGTVEADVCVIGGGLAGLTVGLELARRNRQVVLLEVQRLAFGASGRNGGFVSNGFAESMGAVAARASVDAAKGLYALSRHGTEFIRREIASNDPSISMGEGRLSVSRFDNEKAMRAECDEMRGLYGEDVQLLGTEETRALLQTPRYFQSLLKPSGFHIHPLRYALMIASLAEKAGAVLHENSKALAVEKSGGRFRIRTATGEVRSEHVVHCVSSLDRHIHPPTGRAVLPVATYVVVTEPLSQTVIRTRSSVSDTRRAGNYYRIVDEGRILWGGAITTKIEEPGHLALRMKRDMLSVYPTLGDPRIEHAWAGLMGYALHKMPLIGRGADGQWYATAFGGHGLNTTAMAGILLARAIAASDDEFRRFSPFGPSWAGGPFGRLGVQGSYWWMQLRDRIEEGRSP